MAFDAALLIAAGTDTLVRSEGFDEASFTIVTPGGQWNIELDPDIASSTPLDRILIRQTNNTANVNVTAISIGAAAPVVPQLRVLIQVRDNATGVITPIGGTLDQVYVAVDRMFKEAQP
jgi:hypothetical protein